MTIILERPCGESWELRDVATKLERRAGLPGAHVFDLAVNASRRARSAGLSIAERLALAWPASWLVNSPAVSTVLHRWARAPQHDVWLALVEVLDEGGERWLAERGPERDAEIALALRALGDEPYVIEAVSKVLAVVVPDVVPLLPLPARAFVLGDALASEPSSFATMLDWFAASVVANDAALTAHGVAATPALSGAQVVDRMLWFDSEGHRHFEPALRMG